MSFVVDQNGLLTEPNLHDGFVDGIQLIGKNSAVVALRNVHGQTFSIQLMGLEALVCDEFRQGNIILDVQITSGKPPSKDALSSLYVAPHPSAAAEYHDKHARFIQAQTDRITQGDLVLVLIEPSYGCQLIALCRELLVSPT